VKRGILVVVLFAFSVLSTYALVWHDGRLMLGPGGERTCMCPGGGVTTCHCGFVGKLPEPGWYMGTEVEPGYIDCTQAGKVFCYVPQ